MIAYTDTKLESFRKADGTFGSTLRTGDESYDLGGLLGSKSGLPWDPRKETPVDAILQSGRFAVMLGEALSHVRDAAPAPPNPGAARVAPIVRPGKILALGRTYREHALELGNAPLADPLVFDKLPDAIVGTDAVVSNPDHPEGRLDHEAELALVVGTRAWRLPEGNGRGAVAAIMAANDLTRRTAQKAAQKAGHPWLMAKSFPGSCALGPLLAPVEPATSLERLQITCRVNGSLRQSASTSQLMRSCGALLEWLSQWIPLNPGDVILTGTPAGTGPLVPGDTCEVTITGDNLDLGTLVTRIG